MSLVELFVTNKEADHLLKRSRNKEAKKMQKQFYQSEEFKMKEREQKEFIDKIRCLTKWDSFNLKHVNAFNSLLNCYDKN